jgi:hypothetical protein
MRRTQIARRLSAIVAPFAFRNSARKRRDYATILAKIKRCTIVKAARQKETTAAGGARLNARPWLYRPKRLAYIGKRLKYQRAGSLVGVKITDSIDESVRM